MQKLDRSHKALERIVLPRNVSYKIRKILDIFLKDLTASVSADLLKLNRNTINRYYNLTVTYMTKKWTKPIHNWSSDRAYFMIKFEGRV